MDGVMNFITIFFVVCIAWKSFFGCKRGIYRQLLHTGLTIVSMLIAFFLAKYMVVSVLDGTAAQTLGDLIISSSEGQSSDSAVSIDQIISNSSSLEWIIVLPTATLLCPIVFSLSFVVINLLMQIVYLILRLVFRIEKPIYEKSKNIWGAVVGLVEGILVSVIILLPVAAVSTIAEDGVESIRENDNGQYTDFINNYEENFGRLNDHLVIKTVSFAGGAILDNLATVDIGDERINLRDEIAEVFSIYMSFEALGDVDFSALSANDKQALVTTIDTLERSPYLTTLIAGILSDFGTALEGGDNPVAAEPPFDMIVNDVIHIMATSNRENLIGDMRTILDVYFILSDSGALGSYGEEGEADAMRDSFVSTNQSGETVISSVVTILESNEHTKPLVKTIVQMTITMLIGDFGGESDTVETYYSIKDDFAEVITINRENYATDEEYEAARNGKINAAMLESGVELEPEIVDGIGDYIDENYGDIDELTDEQFNDIILSYFDVFMDMQNEDSDFAE